MVYTKYDITKFKGDSGKKSPYQQVMSICNLHYVLEWKENQYMKL
jgi:hypothetical protein